MPRSTNAQLAIQMFDGLQNQFNWSPGTAWQGIARPLLLCEIWRQGWQAFHDTVVCREVNDFKIGARGPNIVMQRAEQLSDYLAAELGIPRNTLSQEIGLYWKHQSIMENHTK